MLSNESQEVLRNTQAFAELDDDSVELMLSSLREETYPKHELILCEGDYEGKLCFVTGGIAKSYKISPEGKEQIIMLLRNGDHFNLTSIVDDHPSVYDVEAMSDVTVAEITCDKMFELMEKSDNLTMWIARMLASRNRYLISLVEDLSFKTVISRVAKILINYLSLNEEHRKLITQRDMAGIAGTAREVVSRALKTLEDDGYIKMERSHIRIIDKKGLQAIVNEE